MYEVISRGHLFRIPKSFMELKNHLEVKYTNVDIRLKHHDLHMNKYTYIIEFNDSMKADTIEKTIAIIRAAGFEVIPYQQELL